MNYIELHARSAFSFLEGASVPEELIAAGQALEMPAMALLDRDGVYGSPRFHLAAKKIGIKAHIGAELKVQCPGEGQCPTSHVQRHSKIPNSRFQENGRQDVCAPSETFSLPILIRNRVGYQNLCRLITLMKLRVP
jgi:error-prone DNA polymerase